MLSLEPMLLFAAVGATSALSPDAATEAMRTRWFPALNKAAAAQSLEPENGVYPTHCKLAVVGAGWGGAYMAYRLAIDTKTVDPTDVCVFEANGRVGGRIYSIHDLPSFTDLAVDGVCARACARPSPAAAAHPTARLLLVPQSAATASRTCRSSRATW